MKNSVNSYWAGNADLSSACIQKLLRGGKNFGKIWRK